MIKNFKQKLMEVENGRFKNIIEVLSIADECSKCYYLMPEVIDPRIAYRCNGFSCMSTTLNQKLVHRLLKEIKSTELTQREILYRQYYNETGKNPIDTDITNNNIGYRNIPTMEYATWLEDRLINFLKG